MHSPALERSGVSCWSCFVCLPPPAPPSLPQVRPQAGFDPSWRGPVVAAVVVISLLIASLLFASLASFKKQRLLLHETMVRAGRSAAAGHGSGGKVHVRAAVGWSELYFERPFTRKVVVAGSHWSALVEQGIRQWPVSKSAGPVVYPKRNAYILIRRPNHLHAPSQAANHQLAETTKRLEEEKVMACTLA